MKTHKLLQVGVMCFGIWAAGDVWADNYETMLTDKVSGCTLRYYGGTFKADKYAVSWSGKCDSDGFATGSGKYVLYEIGSGKEKFSYQGRLVKGLFDGKGNLNIETSKDLWLRYVGDFSSGRENGKGKAAYSDGDVYIGEFVDGERHGQGTRIYPDGSRYIGGFDSGWPHGYGKFTLIPKSTTFGAWEYYKPKKLGKVYILEGRFLSSSKGAGFLDRFLYECKSQADCVAKERKQGEDRKREQEQREREGARREEQRNQDACKRHYVGKVVDGGVYQIVGIGQTMMTVKDILPGGNWYGLLKEVPCNKYR